VVRCSRARCREGSGRRPPTKALILAVLESPRFSLRLRRFLLVFGYGGLGVSLTLALLTGELHVGKGGPHRAPCQAGYVHNGNDCNAAPGFNSATLAGYNDNEVCLNGPGPVITAPNIICYETAAYWRISHWVHVGDVVHIYFDPDGRVTGLAHPGLITKRSVFT